MPLRAALPVSKALRKAAPQSLDEDIVHPAPAPIHGDADADTLQRGGKGEAGELAFLVGVEDVGPAVAEVIASSRAATQKSASIVFDCRRASTLRLNQSMIATRYLRPVGRTLLPLLRENRLRAEIERRWFCIALHAFGTRYSPGSRFRKVASVVDAS